MAYGVTLEGFKRPRLADIRAEIVQDLQRRLQREVETRPDSITGQQIDTFAEREAALWEQLEAVYLAMYPSSASGQSLRSAVAFTGVQALGALKSRVWTVLYGAQGTLVPAGSQARNVSSRLLWALESPVTITSQAAADATIAINTIASNAEYSVTVDGVEYSYTSDASALQSEIVAGLAQALTGAPYNVSSTASMIRIASDGRAAFSIAVSTNLRFDELGSPGVFASADYGPIEARAGDLSEVVSQIAGWERVNNLQDAAVGRYEENDADLRARYDEGVYRLGAATLPSIPARILEAVPGITAIRVFENDSDVVDSIGRPPHSVHVVAEGGLENEIGEAIFRSVAGGIDTHGDVVQTVIDDYGFSHEIRFDRSTPIYVWIKAQLTLLPTNEAQFPGDGFTRVRQGLLAASNVWGIGDDIVRERLYSGVYQTPGVANADIELAWSFDPDFVPNAGDYSASNITVEAFERARFDLSRIEVS